LTDKRQKIPLLLKLKRFKNSRQIEALNNIFSFVKPARKYKGVPGRILLIRNDRIGDAVVTLAVIRDLKLNYPALRVDVLVSNRNRFVFDDFKYADDVIEFDWTPHHLNRMYGLPVLGGILQVMRYALVPYFFSSSFREKIDKLKTKKYDVAADLVGLTRNALLCKVISRFSIGPKKLGVYVLYDYYINSNWVSPRDEDFMTKKIEITLENALGLTFEKRETSLPPVHHIAAESSCTAFDICFHFGASKLRKLELHKEMELIRFFKGMNVLVTDSGETKNFLELKKHFGVTGNITFKTCNSLNDLVPDCAGAKLLVCYDGGQAHYLSQFVRTLTIFGPGSVALWRPYEFAHYKVLEKDDNGTVSAVSDGALGHIVVYFPIWCRPCFDIGCKERPCLGEIRTEFIRNIIMKYCL